MGPSHTGRGQIAGVYVANEANVSMLRDEKIRVVERQWIVPRFQCPLYTNLLRPL